MEDLFDNVIFYVHFNFPFYDIFIQFTLLVGPDLFMMGFPFIVNQFSQKLLLLPCKLFAR